MVPAEGIADDKQKARRGLGFLGTAGPAWSATCVSSEDLRCPATLATGLRPADRLAGLGIAGALSLALVGCPASARKCRSGAEPCHLCPLVRPAGPAHRVPGPHWSDELGPVTQAVAVLPAGALRPGLYRGSGPRQARRGAGQ